jgi:hypothetical protein
MVLVVGLVMFAFRAGDRTQRKHGVWRFKVVVGIVE